MNCNSSFNINLTTEIKYYQNLIWISPSRSFKFNFANFKSYPENENQIIAFYFNLIDQLNYIWSLLQNYSYLNLFYLLYIHFLRYFSKIFVPHKLIKIEWKKIILIHSQFFSKKMRFSFIIILNLTYSVLHCR